MSAVIDLGVAAGGLSGKSPLFKRQSTRLLPLRSCLMKLSVFAIYLLLNGRERCTVLALGEDLLSLSRSLARSSLPPP